MTEWQYSLTPKEEGICAEIGYLRQKPYFGEPTKNQNYSEGDIQEMWQHSVCAGSELAFARMLGWNDFVPHVNVWKQEQDLVNLCEIRYSFNYDNPRLRYTTRDSENSIYVLITDGLAKKSRRTFTNNFSSPAYIARGWMYGRDCQRSIWEQYSTNPSKTSWLVPADRLRSMDEFLSEVQLTNKDYQDRVIIC